MLDWLRKLIKKKSKQTVIKIKPADVEPPTPQPKTVQKSEQIKITNITEITPKPEHLQKGIVTAASVQDIRMQLEKAKEESARKQFLPEPETHRITHPNSYTPPAERHRDAISKAMKGKVSTSYIKTIKQSPKIKIEEEQ